MDIREIKLLFFLYETLYTRQWFTKDYVMWLKKWFLYFLYCNTTTCFVSSKNKKFRASTLQFCIKLSVINCSPLFKSNGYFNFYWSGFFCSWCMNSSGISIILIYSFCGLPNVTSWEPHIFDLHCPFNHTILHIRFRIHSFVLKPISMKLKSFFSLISFTYLQAN